MIKQYNAIYKKILYIDTDQWYSNYSVSKLKFLKNFHPNIITFFGMGLNIIIYYILNHVFLIPLFFLIDIVVPHR